MVAPVAAFHVIRPCSKSVARPPGTAYRDFAINVTG